MKFVQLINSSEDSVHLLFNWHHIDSYSKMREMLTHDTALWYYTYSNQWKSLNSHKFIRYDPRELE